MNGSSPLGTVDALWRFPVKSLGGEQIDVAEIGQAGLIGDRGYALIDKETGKVVSAKSVRLFPDLLGCSAKFIEQPHPKSELPPAEITLPNGTVTRTNSAEIDGVLSDYFKQKIIVAKTAPPDFTIDQYHPDVEGVDPFGNRGKMVEQKLGAAFFNEMGMDSPVPAGSFFDLFPLSVITTGTLEKLSELQPECNFDPRRFRMNIVLKTDEVGFMENDWIGQQFLLGDDLRIAVTMPDPRCVMTTLQQQGLSKDTGIMRALVQHNRLQVGESGLFPCAGVYAVVITPGTINRGDQVVMI